jgi:hypothetical protein
MNDPDLAEHGDVGNGRSRGDNITSKSDRGTSETYTIARLKRDRPALAQKVVAGEMSANAATSVPRGTRRITASATVGKSPINWRFLPLLRPSVPLGTGM